MDNFIFSMYKTHIILNNDNFYFYIYNFNNHNLLWNKLFVYFEDMLLSLV